MSFSMQASDNDADQGLNALENEDIEDELEERSSEEEEYVGQIEVDDVRLPSAVVLCYLREKRMRRRSFFGVKSASSLMTRCSVARRSTQNNGFVLSQV
jgi:hypothetical protein